MFAFARFSLITVAAAPFSLVNHRLIGLPTDHGGTLGALATSLALAIAGGLSWAMALSLGPAVAGRHAIRVMTYLVVVFSIPVQGLTFGRRVRRWSSVAAPRA